MILKNYEIEKTNISNNKFFLLHGENEGYKDEIIKKITQKFNYKKFLYYEKEILNDMQNFFDTILTKSFFENEKIIVIKSVTDKIIDIINEILKKDLKEIIIILDANILEKKSKIRNLFEKKLISIPFYSDDFKSLNFISQKFFKERKIKVSQESINLIIERSNGSRQHLKNELEKIEFLSIKKKEINFIDVVKLTNLGKDYDISELVENCLIKNHNKLSKIINENNFSNEDTIKIIRVFLYKTKRLLKLNENRKMNQNLDIVISNYKPPIFWKEKEIIKHQMKIWSSKNLKRLISEINKTELLMKKNINISINILLDFIFTNSRSINN